MRPLERETPFLLRALETLNDELHRADPSRPTSMIVGGAWRLNEEVGTTRLADIVGYNGGSVNSSVDGRRVYDICKDADPGRISFMTEGVLNGKADNVTMRADWEKELNVWENYADHWQRFYERDWFCGGAMWVFADYSNKGKYRNMAMVDFWRLPMEGYYFFKAMWSEPLMAHICGHWDWTGGESNERRVVVFSNGEEVELFLNGESLGKGKSCAERWPLIPHPPGEWTVPYVPGKLEAVARRGDEVVRDIRETSGEPAGIAVSVENDTIEADGQDIAFVTATVVDPEGRRCYNAFPRIEIEVDGTCRLAGPGVLEARGGIARFAVRSIGQVGESEIRVSSQGLQSASDSVTAVMS